MSDTDDTSDSPPLSPDDAELDEDLFQHPLAEHGGAWWLKRAAIFGAVAVGVFVVLPGFLFFIALLVEMVVSLFTGDKLTM